MTSRHARRTLPFLLLLSACAGSQDRAPATATAPSSAPLPATPQEAQMELDRLEREIQQDRLALGLPSSDAGGSAAAEGSHKPAEPMASTPSPAPVTEADEAGAVARTESVQIGPHERNRCSKSCRLSQAICQAAQRICRIADYLQEPAARARCGRGQKDCAEARRKSGSCPVCSR